jgi:predicted enzyme related to lactoylglutathione lyase
MTDPIKPGAVLFAKDVARVARFYEALVLMTATHTEDSLIVLESVVFQLVIHGIPAKIARSLRITSPPALRANTAVKLIFPADSIAEVRVKAAALGGGLHPAKREFVARGFRACDGYDPEGNVVQFRERAP